LYSIGFKEMAKNIFKNIDNNSNWKLKLLLAQISISINDFYEAIKFLDEAIELAYDKRAKRQILEEKISVLLNLEKYNEAINILKMEEQTDVSILEMMANIYLKMEEWDLAEECAIKINDIECNENALYILAGLYYKRKDYKKSVNYCKIILDNNYAKESALGCLVNSYLELGNINMAEKYFKKLRAKYSGQLTTIFIHARLQYRKGNIKKAYILLKFIKKQNVKCNEDFYNLYNKVREVIGK